MEQRSFIARDLSKPTNFEVSFRAGNKPRGCVSQCRLCKDKLRSSANQKPSYDVPMLACCGGPVLATSRGIRHDNYSVQVPKSSVLNGYSTRLFQIVELRRRTKANWVLWHVIDVRKLEIKGGTFVWVFVSLSNRVDEVADIVTEL